MRIKNDDNLRKFAASLGENAEEIAKTIPADFIKTGLLKDSPVNYGITIENLLDEVGMADTIFVLFQTLGVFQIREEVFDLFKRLILIGDGLCPFCGGDMELYHYEGHFLPSGERDCEPEWENTEAEYICTACHETIKVTGADACREAAKLYR